MPSSTTSTKISPKVTTTDLEPVFAPAKAGRSILVKPSWGTTEVLSADQPVRSGMDFGTQVPIRSISHENYRTLDKSTGSDVFVEERTIDEKLEISEKKWKSLVNQHSSIFDKNFRSTLIDRFNELSKSEDWEDDDIPVTDESAKTSLELLSNLNPTNPPYIGCDYKGNVRFDWGDIDVCARFSCLPEFIVKWYASYKKDGKYITLGEKEKINEFISNEKHKDIIYNILEGS